MWAFEKGLNFKESKFAITLFPLKNKKRKIRVLRGPHLTRYPCWWGPPHERISWHGQPIVNMPLTYNIDLPQFVVVSAIWRPPIGA